MEEEITDEILKKLTSLVGTRSALDLQRSWVRILSE